MIINFNEYTFAGVHKVDDDIYIVQTDNAEVFTLVFHGGIYEDHPLILGVYLDKEEAMRRFVLICKERKDYESFNVEITRTECSSYRWSFWANKEFGLTEDKTILGVKFTKEYQGKEQLLFYFDVYRTRPGVFYENELKTFNKTFHIPD